MSLPGAAPGADADKDSDTDTDTGTGTAGGAPLTVTVTGSGTPIPCPGRAGPGALVRSGETLLQFDAGRGTVLRLAEAGVSPGELTALFITHYHSDHMIDVADVILTRWIRRGEMPFPAVAPEGPAARMLEGVVDFWEDDIAIRQSHGGRPNRPQLQVNSFTPSAEPAVVWKHGEAVVTSVEVHHEPVRPAVAYRVDTPGGSVTISGDTRVCPAVFDLGRGSDILVHEAMRSEAVLAAGMPHVARYHADTRELGRAAAELGVKTLVLTHLEPSPRDSHGAALFADDVRAGGFDGQLVVARDLVTVDAAGNVYW